MAIDLNKLAAKHAELNGGARVQGNADFLSKFFQVPVGTSAVRILPPADEDKEFYAETRIHRIAGPDGQNRNVHCLKTHGEKCPLCDAYYELWDQVNSGKLSEEDAEKAKSLANKIRARERYYINILDRNSEDVKILSIGKMLFNKIISTMLDDDYGDISDVNEGFDFKIIKEQDSPRDWPKYDKSAARPKSTPLGTDQEISSIMESLHDIHGLVKKEEYEDVKKVAMQVLGVPDPSEIVPTESAEVADTGDYLSKMKS